MDAQEWWDGLPTWKKALFALFIVAMPFIGSIQAF